MTGRVDIVGAGPGDADWLTVDAVRRLAAADVVVVDALVNPVMLAHTRWTARIIDVGKRAGRPSPPQEEICRVLVAEARAGARVVRLKGGDPGTFGRLAEELDALDSAGVPWAIIPGISAAAAAAARAGMPLTDRDSAASVTLLTGHRREDGDEAQLDWNAAGRAGTVVVYMGILQVAENVDRLRAAGMRPDAPVAIVRWASAPREAVLRTTLDRLATTLSEHRVKPPALWLVGEVAARAAARPPLRRGTVALFRPIDENGASDDWADRLAAAGWSVMAWPLQRIEPLPLDLSSAPAEGWVLWSSPTAVRLGLSAIARNGLDVRLWAGRRIAAVGKATAVALATAGLVADVVAVGGDGADGLVARLLEESPSAALWFGAEDARPGPAASLRAAGWNVHSVPTHRKHLRPAPWTPLSMALNGGWLDAAIWTAASQVRAVAETMPGEAWAGIRHVAIGKQTAEALADAGWPAEMAPTPDFAGVLAALESAT